jgi:DNA (cytosine-5)-methyltransferase 1
MGYVYYNENDPFAAAWLRELIGAEVIADGYVDERDIREVRARDLEGWTQCHFFAGIGGWSYALRLAGWPDDKSVWTGSCPCQPFSAAGKREGFRDPRHLWPEWWRLVRECKPVAIFGEQVDAGVRGGWLDLVAGDLESEGYRVGAAVMGAHSVGAPHRRQRLYWVADAGPRRQQHEAEWFGRENDAGRSEPLDLADSPGRLSSDRGIQRSGQHGLLAESSGVEQLADSQDSDRRPGECREKTGIGTDGERGRRFAGSSQNGDMGHATERGLGVCGSASGKGGRTAQSEQTSGLGNDQRPRLEGHDGNGRDGHEPGRLGEDAPRPVAPAGILNGFWRSADWLWCRDQKYRPVEPGTFPLAHGVPARVGRLRGYGNAIVPQVAAAFIQAYAETIEEEIRRR